MALAGLAVIAVLVLGGAWLLRNRGGMAFRPAAGALPAAVLAPDGTEAGSDSDLLDDCFDISNSSHPQLGKAQLARLAAAVKAMGDGQTSGGQSPGSQAAALYMQLAQEHLRQDNLNEAFALLQQIDTGFGGRPPAEFLRLRAATNLRAAETANCIGATNRFLCLLNGGSEGVYQNQGYSLNAIADFETLLRADPSDVVSRWLLNIAHMTIGSYPEGVPEAWRIPPEVFASEHDAPRFVNLAPDLGLADVNLLGAAVMEDFDGDGLLDIFTTSYHPCQHALFYHNNGDGSFEDRSAASGLDRQLGGFDAEQTDYDNDGDADILIQRGGWQADFGRHRRSLVRNNGDGTFSDVTHAAGLAEVIYAGQTAVWADYDLDGDLDFYAANETSTAGPFPSQLFRNNGDGSFTDVAPAAGVTNDVMAKGAAWGDTDNDGDPDLYVSNIGPNRLYRNNGDGTFTDVAPALGVIEPAGRSFATWFWDYDNDGWLDIFVAGYDASLEQIARGYMGQPAGGAIPRLYRNNGRGGFEDVTVAVGLDRVLLPMGSNFGDIDNDGFEDIYLGTGDPEFTTLTPNVMFWNDGGERFYDVTSAAGVGHLPKGHGIAFGDIDNDGDQDIFLQAGGFYPSDVSPNALFENPGGPQHWLTVKLVGTRANRPAIGARLRLVVDGTPTPGADGERTIHRLIGTGSSFGANSLQAEVGLGEADRVKRIEVTWPGNPTPQVFDSAGGDPGIAADQTIELTEGDPDVRVIPRPAIRLQRLDQVGER